MAVVGAVGGGGKLPLQFDLRIKNRAPSVRKNCPPTALLADRCTLRRQYDRHDGHRPSPLAHNLFAADGNTRRRPRIAPRGRRPAATAPPRPTPAAEAAAGRSAIRQFPGGRFLSHVEKHRAQDEPSQHDLLVIRPDAGEVHSAFGSRRDDQGLRRACEPEDAPPRHR